LTNGTYVIYFSTWVTSNEVTGQRANEVMR